MIERFKLRTTEAKTNHKRKENNDNANERVTVGSMSLYEAYLWHAVILSTIIVSLMMLQRCQQRNCSSFCACVRAGFHVMGSEELLCLEDWWVSFTIILISPKFVLPFFFTYYPLYLDSCTYACISNSNELIYYICLDECVWYVNGIHITNFMCIDSGDQYDWFKCISGMCKILLWVICLMCIYFINHYYFDTIAMLLI